MRFGRLGCGRGSRNDHRCRRAGSVGGADIRRVGACGGFGHCGRFGWGGGAGDNCNFCFCGCISGRRSDGAEFACGKFGGLRGGCAGRRQGHGWRGGVSPALHHVIHKIEIIPWKKFSKTGKKETSHKTEDQILGKCFFPARLAAAQRFGKAFLPAVFIPRAVGVRWALRVSLLPRYKEINRNYADEMDSVQDDLQSLRSQRKTIEVRSSVRIVFQRMPC